MSTKHNHDRNGGPLRPGEPSAALPFGRLMGGGECPRCDELRGGAAPREDHAGSRRGQADRDRADVQAHFRSEKHRSGKCGIVCTYGQW
jgi:hypothetical protein